MKKSILTIVCLALAIISFGQDVPFDKKLFKERKDEYKVAEDHYEEGNMLFEMQDYPKAINEYLEAYKFNPKSADLNYKLGICYYNVDKYKMKKYFEDAYSLKPTVSKDVLVFIGLSYHIEAKWEKAIDYYNKAATSGGNEFINRHCYYSQAGENPPTVSAFAYKGVQECKNGIELSKTRARVWIDNVGGEINSKYPDYGPVISADEAIMIFTARRPDNEVLAPDGRGYFEDMFISSRTDGVWSKSKNMGKTMNESGQHDATISLSPDGHTLFIYINEKNNGGDIYISSDETGSWSKPEPLGKNINTDFHESGASLSFDGKRLYFVTNKPDGFGKHDIYYADWDDKKEKWGEAVNVGDAINTPYDERSVFIHPDGETMYFASTGHNTMGGYDLFYSKLVDGKWQTPVNLGPPLNTPDHDIGLVVAGNGRYGYIASYREGGLGEKDIYLITFLGPEKPPMLSNEDNLIASIAKPIKEKTKEPVLVSEGANMAILTGIIRDEDTKEPLQAQVVLIDNEKNKVIAEFNSDVNTGKYLVSLPGGSNYGIAVKKDGYLFHSENFQIPEASGFKQYKKDVDLKKVQVGKSIVLRNIFFDYAKYSLRDESVNELERLIGLLNENPTMRIEISGHTDTRGSDADNQVLSQNRAKSVVDYLISHGIDKSRLEYAGYGEKQTLIPDSEINKMRTKSEKEEAHQQNRRTEFKILSI
ncbi:OmpA family protein [Paracrocinitomix mangrovi]|uniref:OmpA family protein n=1 Tax=Paracrocinitomix mangrovi TaxID=2862509 RepID=UPI001C8D6205|nr:OmpA family protein [Paracrocinitomix mangrovi]UKN01514.1 OmpA family protein [Paracrocinitomix mangrovi]